jgi:hypothetical protein
LNAGSVSHTPHDTVQGVNFPNEMTFAKPADRWIAGHRANRIDAMRHQDRRGTHARSCGCCLAASVPTTDHNDIRAHHRVSKGNGVTENTYL